jgi:hypothetical protein
MKSSKSMVPTALEYRRGLLVAPYIFSMPHNIGGVTNLGEKSISKFKNTPPNDDEGGVNGLNLITQFFKYVYTNWLLPIGNQ